MKTLFVIIDQELKLIDKDFAYFVCIIVGVQFTEEPSDADVRQNNSLALNCTVTGSEPITYQWFKDGSEVPGETGDMLMLSLVDFPDFGIYNCTATNDVSTIRSQEAVVAGTHSESVIKCATYHCFLQLL